MENTENAWHRRGKKFRKIYRWISFFGFPIALFALYFGDPLPFPNPADPDFGHGNFGVHDGRAFQAVDEGLMAATGLLHRFVIEEESIYIGVYDAPHFVLTLVPDYAKQKQGLTGTGQSFTVPDPLDSANKFAAAVEKRGYKARVVPKFLPRNPDKFYVVLVTDPNVPESEWWNQPLLGWQPAFRNRTTSLKFPKFTSFEEFRKKIPFSFDGIGFF